MAVIYHSEPRYTKDIDLWVSPDRGNAEVVYRSLQQFGAPLIGVTVDDFANPELFYQMVRPPLRVDILMSIPGGDFERAWERRIEVQVDGIAIPFISRADLIENKRATGRPQDLLDVEAPLMPTGASNALLPPPATETDEQR